MPDNRFDGKHAAENHVENHVENTPLFDLMWLAGWLEGEGSFYARLGPDGYLKISVSAKCTDLDVVQRAQRIAGGSINGPHSANSAWKPIWAWGVQARDEATLLMRRLRPFMGARRTEQIDTALAFEGQAPRRLPARHGTIGKYNGGCKCEPCRLAQNAYQRDRRRRLREARDAG